MALDIIFAKPWAELAVGCLSAPGHGTVTLLYRQGHRYCIHMNGAPRLHPHHGTLNFHVWVSQLPSAQSCLVPPEKGLCILSGKLP